jgi:DMSO/TMAO reductase YedYZ molybdopterin-dependent catalytic subunit
MSTDVVTEVPLNRHASWEGLAEEITPTEHFFCRNHNPFPEAPTHLDWAGHQLTVEELRQLPWCEVTVTLECAGNGRTEFSPVPPGTPWGIRGVSTGKFGGVALHDLVTKFPAEATHQHLIFVGADLGPEGYYERSLTIAEAIELGALVALEMNGEPLSAKHGAPCRLVVPGYYAMTSIKWLQSVRYSETASNGYYQIQDYLVEYPGTDIPVRPATLMKPKSLIISPLQGKKIQGLVVIEGKAWGSGGPVSEVEVELSALTGEDCWTSFSAKLEQTLGTQAWCNFQLQLPLLSPGNYRVRARCRIGEQVQPLVATWNSQGYENNSAHVVHFEVVE